ncbi:uncharacterized protein LOC121738532 isoform X2 [Aricia agestis]|uniref:uncharacterized protein LOC121738532 isoform X2 n=1 Tax=Aricia agestis TaxID=91739 RepID=UPI001C20AC06|nr:uncharacterized protein LOC121738532 isoform X2 [Aricia agestis]
MQPIHKKMDPKPDTLHTDTFNESVSSILERKVRGWLSGVIEDMRRNSPVQQWLDSLPPDVETPIIVTTTEQSSAAETAEESKKTDTKSDENKAEDTVTENTVVENNIDLPHDDSDKTEVPVDKESIKTKLLETKSFSTKNKSKLKRDHSIQSEGNPPRFKNPLLRDHSLQSDGSGSSGSSVLNVLGARRVDAESVLLALGFGPSEKQQQLQRIPDRFLSPSKLKGISTEEFIKHEQHSMRMHDCGIFGYRGLTEHCTPVCRFMKPVSPTYQVPEIALQESACTTVDNCS